MITGLLSLALRVLRAEGIVFRRPLSSNFEVRASSVFEAFSLPQWSSNSLTMKACDNSADSVKEGLCPPPPGSYHKSKVRRTEDSSENGGRETSAVPPSSGPFSCGDSVFEAFQLGDGSRKLLHCTEADALACLESGLPESVPGAAGISRFDIQRELEVDRVSRLPTKLRSCMSTCGLAYRIVQHTI